MKEKIKVFFPSVEAGFGHIMTERSIADAFEEKYGDRCEVIRQDFYKSSGNPRMMKFEKDMASQVRLYNRMPWIGYFISAANNVFGSHISTWFVCTFLTPGAYGASKKAMEKISPDVVVSTHWATNYVAKHLKKKPLTVVYVPDCHVNACFRYPADLTMISAKEGYNSAKKRFLRFNKDNFKLVPFAIRKEAFSIENDKVKLRKELGMEEKFTVLVMDGAYGIGLMEKISEEIVKKDLPVNVIAMCGSNKALLDRLSSLKTGKNTNLYAYGFREDILKFIAASDIYFGKSGNGIAEPTFFGNPAIVTHCANYIENRIAQHYINIGNTKKIFLSGECVKFIEDALNGGEEFLRMREAAKNAPPFGSEKTADEIFYAIDKKYGLTRKNA